jgi:hypothetical protein
VNGTDASAGSAETLELRRYQDGDADAVRGLHDLALMAAGVHLGRGPWDEDLDAIPATYLETGGEFLVGFLDR